MGTRSITRFYDTAKDEVPFATLYRQMDGYPTGHGDDLAGFLRPIEIVNGIGAGVREIANGMGCLAAQVVAHLKNGPGGFYLRSHHEDTEGLDYVYEVYPSAEKNGIGVGKPMLRVRSGYHKKWLYKGSAADFDGKAIERN